MYDNDNLDPVLPEAGPHGSETEDVEEGHEEDEEDTGEDVDGDGGDGEGDDWLTHDEQKEP